jgi:secretion/DNA translocation related CpaE-like protein
VVAAAGVPAQACPPGELTAQTWSAASLVLLDTQAAAAVPAQLPRRAGVVLLADADDATAWRLAVDVGAEHVAVLPDAEDWLVRRCVTAAGPVAAGLVLGVVGGCGGAGASVFAAVLGDQARQLGVAAALVDLDPTGGGLDLLLGAEAEPGVRWQDLAAATGRLPAATLMGALPAVDGLPVLAFGRRAPGLPEPATAHDVLTTITGASVCTVLDLPRALLAAPGAAGLEHGWGGLVKLVVAGCDAVVLIVPADVRAAAAAAGIADTLRTGCADVRLVVRGPSPSWIDGVDVAATVGLPLWAEVPAESELDRTLDAGDVPGRHRRSVLGGLGRRLLDTLPLRAAA